MASTGRTNERYVLWGAPLSLYTGKARSCLIKKGVSYVECHPTNPVFHSRILPAIGFFVVPVLEAPDGTIVQDTTEILEHLEARFPESCTMPNTPVQRSVALLIGAWASEGLLRPAMHYRWSQPHLARNEAFLRAEFGRVASASRDRKERDAAAMPFVQAMQAYLPALGVSAATIPAIEQAYEETLDVLEAHFNLHPYVLGGRPSVADFGLMAPLFAHLSRDPSPSDLMKRRAPNVYRWTERMNLANIQDGEFPDVAAEYPEGDAIPATLEPLLTLIFRDWGPEVLANAKKFNDWIASVQAAAPGTIVAADGQRKLHPTLGPIEFVLRGQAMTCVSFPQMLWHFERAAQAARALAGDARARFDALMRRTRGADVMGIALARGLRRENFVLVTA